MGATPHDGDGFGCVLDGPLTLRIGEAEHGLGPGDALAFPPNLVHSNPGSDLTRANRINTPPTF